MILPDGAYCNDLFSLCIILMKQLLCSSILCHISEEHKKIIQSKCINYELMSNILSCFYMTNLPPEVCDEC